jgi:acetolactate decarboxylase
MQRNLIMKRHHRLFIGGLLLLTGCTAPNPGTIFQISTIDALLAGVYEGNFTCGELLGKGNFGIGTFNDLDGEMLVLNRKVYQVKADGKVYEPGAAVRTPFAAVCDFRPGIGFQIDSISDIQRVEKLIDQQAANQNLFCAIRISGRFLTIRTRSVPRQKKPFPPLTEVTANQPEFTLENVQGTLIGFRFPSYVKGMNMPGYHLHFISGDRTAGGHILSFTLVSGKCEIEVIHQFLLRLPEGDSAFAVTDLSKDRSGDLQKAEGADQ